MTDHPDAAALRDRLETEAPAPARDALRLVERLCAERGLTLYLVGGAVRDLLLGRSQVDLDLVIEAGVAPIARALAAETGGKAVLHDRFGTAHVTGPVLGPSKAPSFHLDLAQTRRETYAHPGALPTVERRQDILDDLSRRDFTLNAIALRLTPPVELLDPFGGAADLAAGLLRVLHEDSFRDDATRMLRAVRYAARLHLRLDTVTEIWLQRDLEFLDAVSGPRLRRELELLFAEPGAADGALLASRLGVLSAIEPRLRINEALASAWRDALAGRHYAPLAELGFCLVASPQDAEDVTSVSRRLHLHGRVDAALNDLVRLRGVSDKLSPDDAVQSAALLDGFARAAVWALSLLDGASAGQACRLYLEEWQHVRPALTGKDLLAMGLPSGERIGAALRRLREARLRGEVSSREEELALFKQLEGGVG